MSLSEIAKRYGEFLRTRPTSVSANAKTYDLLVSMVKYFPEIPSNNLLYYGIQIVKSEVLPNNTIAFRNMDGRVTIFKFEGDDENKKPEVV